MPNFLLEIGTEELPADFIDNAILSWKTRIPETLATELITPETVQVYATPRRLAVLITGLPERQANREEEIKGPPLKAAFQDGKPTQAAEGFARKQGVSLDDFQIRDTDKGEFVFIQKQITGKNTTVILQDLAPKWITELEGRRFMRWGDGDLRFPRPIRTLVALLDREILPLELINGSTVIKSDRLTSGHRTLHPEKVSIPEASDYVETLKQAHVMVDSQQRLEEIKKQVQAKAKELGGKAEIYFDLLGEVNNLVEYSTAVIGNFEEEFLQLPAEVITTVMVKHQRYFPVKDEKGNLLPNFITISNGDPAKSELIATGNAKVIRARLADAQFFYQADCDEHLECYLPQLENVTFQEDLGSIRDKVDRILEISLQIADQLDVTEKQRLEIESTALLSKADLVTQMVYEFPELQGVMGEKYALVSGESETVAKGIFEHYLPRGVDDLMPQTLNGQVVGIGDRLDTVVSIFGLGMIPTGSSDPFAIRRAANGIINITWHSNLSINLGQLLEQACHDFVMAHPQKPSPLTILQEFFLQRIATLLQEELQIDYDLVNAVLGENDAEYSQRALFDLLDVRDRAQFLQHIRQNGMLDQIYETVNRSTRLAREGDLDTEILDPQKVVNPDLFESPSEQAFYAQILKLLPITKEAKQESNYQLLVESLAKIAPTVSDFFDGENSVLVMVEDEKIRQNRLNLLGLLRNHARILADFGAVVKS
jgi:glycyl-tRNA synthetase beta chain